MLQALPENIGDLQRLKILVASDNQLTKLPESIGRLTQLEALELENNQLSDLPESIGELSNLKHDIALYGNPIIYLPDGILDLPVDICEQYSLPTQYGY